MFFTNSSGYKQHIMSYVLLNTNKNNHNKTNLLFTSKLRLIDFVNKLYKSDKYRNRCTVLVQNNKLNSEHAVTLAEFIHSITASELELEYYYVHNHATDKTQ